MQGQLVAVNLGSGKIAWRVPLGSLEDEYGAGAKDMGAASIGPTLATRGGVVFAAASDDRFYAHDERTGPQAVGGQDAGLFRRRADDLYRQGWPPVCGDRRGRAGQCASSLTAGECRSITRC